VHTRWQAIRPVDEFSADYDDDDDDSHPVSRFPFVSGRLDSSSLLIMVPVLEARRRSVPH
jgi:hypothetical protein